ncbi:MAG: hypothetical protein GX299_01900 [Epulopiscium sp.]|jgi:membrane-bound ClpP family serine protease|nr:hypothetical protein [Candidatus Epulonipiscium sp.]
MLPWIVILAIIGLVLVVVEMLIPGFGVFGILGAAGLVATTLLVAFEYGTAMFLMAVGGLILLFVIIIQVLRTKNVYNKFVLTEKLDTQDFDESSLKDLEGKEGVTITPLKPYGKGEFEGRQIDVFSKGEYIEKNKPIRIIEIRGKNVVVQEIVL